MSYKSLDRRFHNPQICRFLFSIFMVISLERNYFKWSCPLSLPLYDVERRPEMVEPLNIALFFLSPHIGLSVLGFHKACMEICWNLVRVCVNTSHMLVKSTRRIQCKEKDIVSAG